jgi:hypothetical protein
LKPEGFPSFEPEGFFVGRDQEKGGKKTKSGTKVQHGKLQPGWIVSLGAKEVQGSRVIQVGMGKGEKPGKCALLNRLR